MSPQAAQLAQTTRGAPRYTRVSARATMAALLLGACAATGDCLSVLGPEQTTSLRAWVVTTLPAAVGAQPSAAASGGANAAVPDSALAVGAEAGAEGGDVGASAAVAVTPGGVETRCATMAPASRQAGACTWPQTVRLPCTGCDGCGDATSDVFLHLELEASVGARRGPTVVAEATLCISSLLAAGGGTAACRSVTLTAPPSGRAARAAISRAVGELSATLVVQDDGSVDAEVGKEEDRAVEAVAGVAGVRRDTAAVSVWPVGVTVAAGHAEAKVCATGCVSALV